MSKIHDLIIVGAGITGLHAARQAASAGVSTLLIEQLLFGGLITNVNELDGEIEDQAGGNGSDIASQLMMQVMDLGADSAAAQVTGLHADGALLRVDCDGDAYQARAVIIASGARLKRLGVPGEAELVDRGVSQCADCDGSFHRGRDVVVVGGGDSALQEAVVLAAHARTVHLVHRGTRFSGQAHLQEGLRACPNITVHWATTVQAVLGDDSVRAVRLCATETGATRELDCSGLFAYVGLEPACEFVPAAVARDERGHLLTDAALATAMPGVFAAGAVRAGYGGLLRHAVAEGIAAADAALARLR